MSTKQSGQVQMNQDKVNFSREIFYSMLNDTATECNQYCGSNQSCYKNCVVKNKQLINTLRDALLYSGNAEKVLM